jgi:hypothetical protein
MQPIPDKKQLKQLTIRATTKISLPKKKSLETLRKALSTSSKKQPTKSKKKGLKQQKWPTTGIKTYLAKTKSIETPKKKDRPHL